MHAETISNLFAKGINPNDKTILGYHGTSLMAFKHALKHGVFKPGPFQEASPSISFFPNLKHSYFKNHNWRSVPVLNPEKEASIFANSISERHFLLEKLNLDPNNLSHVLQVMDVKDSEAKKQKGVLISISDSIIDKGSLVFGDDDMKILTSGLSLEFINGIEPLDDSEWEFFEKLQKKTDANKIQ